MYSAAHRLALGVFALLGALGAGVQESKARPKPVAEVSKETIEVADGAFLPIYVSHDCPAAM